MIRTLRFSGQARNQLAAIHGWVANAAGSASADTLVLALIDHCEILRDTPFLGAVRDDVRPGLRTIAYRRRYTIGYRVDDDAVTILGIIGRGQQSSELAAGRR